MTVARRVFRPEPALPVGAVKTYQIKAPVATHWRSATCAEVDCPNHLNGWKSIIDEATDLGQAQAYYIRHDRTRRHVETREGTGLTVFTFEPGQTCFIQHQTRVDRPELFIVKKGDWRGSTGDPRYHSRPEDWVDDFATHQDKVAKRIERG